MELQDPSIEHIILPSSQIATTTTIQKKTRVSSRKVKDVLNQIVHKIEEPVLEEIYPDSGDNSTSQENTEWDEDMEKHRHSTEIINKIMNIVPIVQNLRRKSFMQNPMTTSINPRGAIQKIEPIVNTVIDVAKTIVDVHQGNIEVVIANDVPNIANDLKDLQKEFETLPAIVKQGYATVAHWKHHKIWIDEQRELHNIPNLPYY